MVYDKTDISSESPTVRIRQTGNHTINQTERETETERESNLIRQSDRTIGGGIGKIQKTRGMVRQS